MDFILGYYDAFGLTATLKFATRPEKRIGDDALWDRAEAGARAALEATGMPYELKPGDGAFYGPKIDFDVTDSHRPQVAAGHDPARLQRARALRPHVRRRGQRRAPAGGDPPRHERLVRALHRHPHRALRRRVPGLARARAGARDADLRRADRGGPAASPSGSRRPASASTWTTGARRSTTGSARARCGRSRTWRSSGQREAESDSLALRVRGAGKKQEVMPVDAFLGRVTEEVRARSLVP